MSWTTPKTTWTSTDRFNPTDYNRIKGNLNYLKDLSITLFNQYSISDMGSDKTYSSYYYADEINLFESNLELINTHSYQFDIGTTKTYVQNGTFITYDELNRIESACLNIYNMLNYNQDNLWKLIPVQLITGGRIGGLLIG